jgi:CheY-like chemotaxis protein
VQTAIASGRVILAIDDDPQVISLYERYLQPQGYQVIALTDPAQAVDTVRQLKPFAVTLDIMMPGRDGWTVLSELKNSVETRAIPVIMCSILEKNKKGFSLGAADYLVKPVLEEDLLNALNRLNSANDIRNVLVIDDNPSDLNLIERILKTNGRYQPVTAKGGKAGWEKIQEQKPDAVILDLFMPDLDGFSILGKLRSTPEMSLIPVIVVSGADLTAEQHSQLAEFGQELLQKGALNEKDLLLLLDRALQRIQTQG